MLLRWKEIVVHVGLREKEREMPQMFYTELFHFKILYDKVQWFFFIRFAFICQLERLKTIIEHENLAFVSVLLFLFFRRFRLICLFPEECPSLRICGMIFIRFQQRSL